MHHLMSTDFKIRIRFGPEERMRNYKREKSGGGDRMRKAL